MRLTTKVWLIVSVITLAVVLASAYVSVEREVDRRVSQARQFNRTTFAGIQLLTNAYGKSFITEAPKLFKPEDLQRFLGGGSEVSLIELIELYGPDGERLITTDPAASPAEGTGEAIAQALRGETTSGPFVLGEGAGEGERIDGLSLARILKGGEFADEFWAPLTGPDGETLGVTRALIGMPGLHEEVVGIVTRSAITAGALVLVLWLAVGGALHLIIRRPLAVLTSTIRRIRSGELSVRAPLRGRDELGELATSFNAMADGLEQQATTDYLTGLLNHGYANLALAAELERARAAGRPLSLLIADIDGFKRFNDTYGHPLGDEALKLVAGIFRELCGDLGFASRYGGDEFVAVLPGADRDEARAFADRLNVAVGEAQFPAADGSRVPIALSVGFACFPDDSVSKDHLLAQADSAMYQAKRIATTGREAPRVVEARARSGGAFAALDSLVQSIQYRDHYTKDHSDVVADYASRLALRAGLSEEAARALRIAGVLHDVGKIVVPDDVLKKPGPLTEEEREVMRRHPSVGEMLISEGPFLEDVVQAVGCHHEHYDGSGYPRGLKGDQIPLLGRVIAVADAYSAMFLDRPYRKGLPLEEIIAQLRAGAGSQFEPRLVDLFVDMLEGERERRAA